MNSMIGQVIPGRSVGQALLQAGEQLRSHQRECQASLHKLDETSNEWLQRQGKTFQELAEHYLPEVSQQAVLHSFRGIRDELLNVLERKQRRERQLQGLLEQDETEATRLQASLEQATTELNEKVAERQQLEDVVAERLKENQPFKKLSQEALVAEQELNRNEGRVAEIKQEASEKLPDYEQDRLFCYLRDCGYGTADYKKKGITRTLDRWVAKLVKFNRARRSYDFLRVTPELMEAEVVRRREMFNVLMEKIEAIEDKISAEVGLTEVLRQGQLLGTRRDDLVADLGRLEKQFTQHHQELLSLEGPQNEFYVQGVAEMKAFLAKMEQSWLEHQARGTPERVDDELVAELRWLNEQLDKARGESNTLMREQRNWDERSEGLQDVLQRFRRADFDSRRSLFDGEFDVERHVGGYLRGEIGREELWSVLRRYQHFHQPRQRQRDWDSDASWEFETMGGVLGRVLIEVAGEAMKHAVRRGMERRGPYRHRSRKRSGDADFDFPWFTQGRGF